MLKLKLVNCGKAKNSEYVIKRLFSDYSIRFQLLFTHRSFNLEEPQILFKYISFELIRDSKIFVFQP